MIIVSSIVLASCGKIDERKQGRPPVPVRVMAIETTNHAAQRSYVGTIKAGREVSLSAKVPATVENVSVAQGDRIVKDSTAILLHSQTIQSTYDMTKAMLDQAEDAYARLIKVRETNSVPDIQMVELESKLQQAKAQFRAAAQSLADCRLRSPFTGIVAAVNTEKDYNVQPLETLVKIFDMASLEVHISVPETEIGYYKVGDTADVIIPALKNRRLRAVVSSKGIDASSVSHTYSCVLSLNNVVEGVMPGMVSKVFINKGDEPMIVVPSACIKLDNEGQYVWVVVDSVVEKRYLVLGEFSGRGVIVVNGLASGDKVITDGSRKVSVGSKVEIVE